MDPNSQAEKAYEAIRTMIMNRSLRPGASLAVHELAQQLEMSVTPVREAIRRLESEGLLEVVPRRGTFVKSFSVEDLITGFEVAEAYEGMAAYLAAERVQQGELFAEDLEYLQELLGEMQRNLGQNQAAIWGALDTKFHETICTLSNNIHIWQSYQKVRAQMDCVLWFITPLHVDRSNSNREHGVILEAIKAGDMQRARETSQNHRNNVRRVLRSLTPGGNGT